MAKQKTDGEHERKLAGRGYNRMDNFLTHHKRFREIDSLDCQVVVLCLYLAPTNRSGWVEVSTENLLFSLTTMNRDEIEAALTTLEDQGYISREGSCITLLDWQKWMGGEKESKIGDTGRLKVTREFIRKLKRDRDYLPDKPFRAWVDASGYESSDALFGVLDEPTNQGGDHCSEEFRAKANQKQSKSKAEANQKQSKSKAKANTQTQTQTQNSGIRRRRKSQDSNEDEDAPTSSSADAELTTKVADAYAKEFLGRKGGYGGDTKSRPYVHFGRAAKRIAAYCQRSSTFDEDQVLKMLIEVCKAQAEGFNSPITPANLCSDTIWDNALPQRVKRILGR